MTDIPDSQCTSSRVAVVTGAGKGLGRTHALALADRGFAVLVNNRTHPGIPSSADRVVEEIAAKGGTASAHGASVDDPAQAVDLIESAIARYGRLDALVCNAGIMPRAPFHMADLDELRRLVEINLWGAVYPLQRAWRHMLETGYGRIVLTGSAVGLYGHAEAAMYGATRSAVVGLARSLALEVPAGADIGINVILPLAYTDMAAQEMGADEGANLPAEKVSHVVSWLCAEDCKVSGRIFHSGGGRVSRVGVTESVSVPVEAIDMTAIEGGALGPLTKNEPTSAGQASYRMLTGNADL